MNDLPAEGLDLFKAFKEASDAWAKYIVPVAIQAFERRLSSLGKKHCKLAGMGLYESSHSSSDSSFSSASKAVDGSDAECKSIYKKLAMMFHPDKFKGSDEIFKSIFAYASIGDYKSLRCCQHLAESLNFEELDHEAMENITKIVANTQLLHKYNPDGPAPAVDSGLGASGTPIPGTPVPDTDMMKAAREAGWGLEHCAYRWFIGDANVKETYERMYLTDDELIEDLKYAHDNKLHVYMGLCRENTKVMEAIKEILTAKVQKAKAENIRLKTQHAQMKEMLQQMNEQPELEQS